MGKTFRIGVLGLTHDHVWGVLKELQESQQGTVVAAADPHEPLRQRVKKEHGCSVYENYGALLESEKLDAVYIYADNATGPGLAEFAAEKGLHILIEKPMAASLEGADRALAAVRRKGVRLMVNWPFAWRAQMQAALQLAQNGTLGDVWQVKYRAAHQGPREHGCSPYFCDWLYRRELNGAGAFMDYCCYGAVLARCLLGLPSKVTAVAGRLCKEDIVVEDNAVLLMSYPQALAISEGSWTQIGKLTAYQTAIYGTKGTLLVEPGPRGRVLLATAEQPDGFEVTVPALPGPFDASSHFLKALETGEPFTELCTDRNGRDVQEILEAGLLSIARGSEVSLPLCSYHGKQ